MKTVLAPNAPWPKPPAAEPKPPRKPKKPPAQQAGQRKLVDAKFADWLAKQGTLL